jgi:hypothetical protein
MNALLTAVVLWLSTNFDLPAIYDHPRVELAPAAKIVALRYGDDASMQLEKATLPAQSGRRDIVSVYDDATKTIYLPADWTGSTPAELSVLVHETVHHLQNVGGLKFECPREREQLAYKAQERWLGLFGSDLLRDFEIDGFTLLANTRCFY